MDNKDFYKRVGCVFLAFIGFPLIWFFIITLLYLFFTQ